jgi:hypothetical protein
MMVRVGSLLAAGAFVIATVCAATAAPAPKVFELTSSSFRDGGRLAVKNAGNIQGMPNCVGENISPPLAWTDPPDGTKSFALLMFDPEANGGIGNSHMVIYGIPASVTGFAEGEISKPSDKYVGGKNGRGLSTYQGPCTPPNTDWHHYTLILVATDLDPKALEPGLNREDLLAKLKGHAKGTAGLIGKFRHPEK